MLNKTLRKTMYLGSILNAVPLASVVVMSLIGLELLPLIILIGIWSNLPFAFGIGQVFGENHVAFQEFGVSNISSLAFIYQVCFWFLIAWVLVFLVQLFSNKKNK